MKIINILFALTSFASATLQGIAQNRLYNALASHNKHRDVVSVNLDYCRQFLEQATTEEKKSAALASFYCVQAKKEMTSSKNQNGASYRNRRFRAFHSQ